MTQEEQQTAFMRDLDALLMRYADEFDMTFAEIIGLLRIKTHDVERQAIKEVKG